MTTYPRKAPARPQVAARRLLYVAPLASLVAAIVNAVIFFVGSSLGAFPQDIVIRAGMPITLFPIVSLSVLAVLAGAVAFALLGRFTKHPVRNFLIVAALVLVLMAVPPFTIAGAPAAMVVALHLTYLTTAAIAIFSLLRWGVGR